MATERRKSFVVGIDTSDVSTKAIEFANDMCRPGMAWNDCLSLTLTEPYFLQETLFTFHIATRLSLILSVLNFQKHQQQHNIRRGGSKKRQNSKLSWVELPPRAVLRSSRTWNQATHVSSWVSSCVVGGSISFSSLQLPELAKEYKADQIVVGTHGRGFLGRTLLGSVSSYLSQHSEVPVTIVRGQRKQEQG